MPAETRQLPVKEFRLGAMKLSIWENQSDERLYHKATLAHVYRLPVDERDDGDNGWRESTSFSQEDLLLIRELSRLANDWIRAQQQK